MPGEAGVENRDRQGVVAARVALPGGEVDYPEEAGAPLCRIVLGGSVPVEAEPVAADIHDRETGRGASLPSRRE